MKKTVIITLVALSVTACVCRKNSKVVVTNTPKEEVQPQTVEEITSYALGANTAEAIMSNTKSLGIDIDWHWLTLAMKEVAGGNNRFDEQKMKSAFAMLDSVVAEQKKAKTQLQKDFLENNKKKEGINVTASGLQYKIIKLGTGQKPTSEDTVKVNYEGQTIEGVVFDSSYKRGEPTTFPLKSVIKGWTEGLQLMPIGSIFRFYIPSDLAYGQQGAGGGVIEPNATLIFDIELLEIMSK